VSRTQRATPALHPGPRPLYSKNSSGEPIRRPAAVAQWRAVQGGPSVAPLDRLSRSIQLFDRCSRPGADAGSALAPMALLVQHFQCLLAQHLAVQDPGPVAEYLAFAVDENCAGHAQNPIIWYHAGVFGGPGWVADP